MNEFKGTKGKWNIDNLTSECETSIVTDVHRICNVSHFDIKIDKILKDTSWLEGKHNALLISKAPEMLEMLNHISWKTEQICNDSGMGYIVDYDDMDKLRKLIKEATELNPKS
ncbi:hypothetical protein [Chryseobacterium sp. SIMBA_028]|uniref:hypothetical protein n=1 Tax=Chryseobacterium sp. SIMBA_028 TaxID=3085771 RepID=UPI00397C8187